MTVREPLKYWERIREALQAREAVFRGTEVPVWGRKLLEIARDMAVQLDRNGENLEHHASRRRIAAGEATLPNRPELVVTGSGISVSDVAAGDHTQMRVPLFEPLTVDLGAGPEIVFAEGSVVMVDVG